MRLAGLTGSELMVPEDSYKISVVAEVQEQ